MTDDRSQSRIRRNDQRWIDAMFRAEASRLVRYFDRRVDTADDPVDLVQEAFLRFVGRARSAPPDNPVGYLHRIARNLLFERTRRRKTRIDLHDCPLPPDFDIPVPPSQDREIEAAQMMDAYEKALDRLPPKTRAVFLLHRSDGLSYKEVADKFGISVRTVEWHIVKALFRIRRMMDER